MPHLAAPYRLWARVPAPVQDVALALFVTVMQIQGVLRTSTLDQTALTRPLADLGYLGYVLLIVSGLVLIVRRRWPVAVFLITGLASAVYYAADFPDGPGWLALFVAFFTLAAYGDGRRSLIIAAVGKVVLATVWLVSAADIEPRAAIGWVFFRIGASVMSIALGESVRSRRVIAADAEERAEWAERTREEEARARVDAERLRIAREVHDTVAHAIAIINVQAGVTAHILDKRPERARETLVTIEQTSSQALQDMRTILGVLRDDSDGRLPHPGLGQIGELVAKARDAGLDIELDPVAPAAALPSAVDSAAYRILQESITNVIRHVGPSRVKVSLDQGIDYLEIRVTDEGRRNANRADPAVPRSSGAGGATLPGGRGVQGMRERCELLDGEFDAAPTPDGGFEVKARLPLAPIGVGR